MVQSELHIWEFDNKVMEYIRLRMADEQDMDRLFGQIFLIEKAAGKAKLELMRQANAAQG